MTSTTKKVLVGAGIAAGIGGLLYWFTRPSALGQAAADAAKGGASGGASGGARGSAAASGGGGAQTDLQKAFEAMAFLSPNSALAQSGGY